jgi:hypothetical protein
MGIWDREERQARTSSWDPFDDVPSITAGLAAPTVGSCAFATDLLAEIDNLLQERDGLIGFWQAPGE